MVARTAERFGQRPSLLVGIADPLLALQLDEAMALRLALAEAAVRDNARRPGRPWGEKPRGLRYESLDRALAAEMAARNVRH